MCMNPVVGMQWVCVPCNTIVCSHCVHDANFHGISVHLMLRLKSEPAEEGSGTLLDAFLRNPRAATTLFRNLNDAAVYHVAQEG